MFSRIEKLKNKLIHGGETSNGSSSSTTTTTTGESTSGTSSGSGSGGAHHSNGKHNNHNNNHNNNSSKMGEGMSGMSKTSLNDSDLEMLHKVSKKPKEEIKFWFEHFLSECPSGKLDKAQFVKYYSSFRKNEKVDKIAEHAFNAFDADKNGIVDFGEFLIAYVITTSGDSQERLEYVFNMYDKDNNRVIDENEMRTVLKSMFTLLGVDESSTNFDKCIRNIMSSLDKNKDNKISKREFIDGIVSDSYLNALLSPFS